MVEIICLKDIPKGHALKDIPKGHALQNGVVWVGINEKMEPAQWAPFINMD